MNPVPDGLTCIQGAMTFGAPGKEGARVHDIKDVEAILDAFKSHGHSEVCPSLFENFVPFHDLFYQD